MFDSAHRSQNQVVRRQVEKQNAIKVAEDPDSRRPTPSIEGSSESGSTYARSKKGITVPHRWIMYSTEGDQPLALRDVTGLSADLPLANVVEKGLNSSSHSIPSSPRTNAEDASICFYFRHYGGTAIDPEASSGFSQLWRPTYLQASAQSALRLATAAVTVNITTMWCFQGCDTRPARRLFTKAIAAARQALFDPLESSTDEMLITVLVFDLYDSLVLHYAPRPLDYGKHKYGALAILEQRGLANLATPQGRALIKAVRHTILPYLLSSRKPFPDRLDYLFNHLSINDTIASNLDLISVQLSRSQSRQWALRLESRSNQRLEERRACYEEIIEEALQLEGLLIDWKASITDPCWLPEYIERNSVMESIRDAGFYGTHCSVWVDLTYGGTWILFSIRYLLTLQIIRQSFTDEPSLLKNPEHRMLLFKVNEKVQDLVDFICETIPFHLGDTVIPKNPMYSSSVNFPHKLKVNPSTGIATPFPSLRSNHHNRAAASGGWVLFPQLVNVWRLAEPEDDAVPIILREGQLDWIKEQVKRLQRIFLFCEPVWFKRAAPSPTRRDTT